MFKKFNKIFIFRGDANFETGLGHLNRLAILARGVKKSGAEVFFAIKNTDREKFEKSHLADLDIIEIPWKITNIKEFEYISDHPLLRKNPDANKVLVTSRYDVGNEYFSKYAAAGWKVVYFDDLNDRRIDCDILINANFFSAGQNYAEVYKNSKTRLLLGPEYYLIRNEFAREKKRRAPDTKKLKTPIILVTMGGSDYYNMTKKIVRALDKIRNDFEIRIIAGSTNKRIKELTELGSPPARHKIDVLSDISDLARIFSGCDFAVTAGGGTNYELIFLGKPVITFPMTANEKHNSRFIEDIGCGYGIVMNRIPKRVDLDHISCRAEIKLLKYVKALLNNNLRSMIKKRIEKVAAVSFKKEKTVGALLEL